MPALEFSFLRLHELIGKTVRRLTELGPAVRVAQVARVSRKDPRVVRLHLEVMAMDGLGMFLDADRTVFALRDPLADLVRQGVRSDPAAAASYGSAAELFQEERVRARKRSR